MYTIAGKLDAEVICGIGVGIRSSEVKGGIMEGVAAETGVGVGVGVSLGVGRGAGVGVGVAMGVAVGTGVGVRRAPDSTLPAVGGAESQAASASASSIRTRSASVRKRKVSGQRGSSESNRRFAALPKGNDDNSPLRHSSAGCYIVHIRRLREIPPSPPRRREARIPVPSPTTPRPRTLRTAKDINATTDSCIYAKERVR